jgi:hypothetical protein
MAGFSSYMRLPHLLAETLPTLTRLWCRKERRGQRLVEAPGDNRKVSGFGLVDCVMDGRVAGSLLDAPLMCSANKYVQPLLAQDSMGASPL